MRLLRPPVTLAESLDDAGLPPMSAPREREQATRRAGLEDRRAFRFQVGPQILVMLQPPAGRGREQNVSRPLGPDGPDEGDRVRTADGERTVKKPVGRLRERPSLTARQAHELV